MSKICFHTITYQNFRSVGNVPITVELDKKKSTLICGQNGSGKTTVISAMCYALFGKGYGDVTKPALINSINQKKLLVTFTLTVDNKSYKIVRGMKPNIFEIYENGELINQDAASRDYQKVLEQQILKMNYRAFTQAVVVGGGDDYVPFMRLAAKDRRDFIEDLVDIRIFSIMNTLAKERAKTLKDSIKDLDGILKAVKEKVTLQDSFIKKLKKERAESNDKIIASIEEREEESVRIRTLMENYFLQIETLQDRIAKHAEFKNKIAELKPQITPIQRSLSKQLEKKDFYEAMDTCPTCTQDIQSSHKAAILKEYDATISSMRDEVDLLNSTIDSFTQRMERLQQYVDEVSTLQSKISDFQQTLRTNQRLVDDARSQLDDSKNNVTSITDEEEKLKEFAKAFVNGEKKKKKELETQQYYDLVLKTLTDSGIKSKIIKQYIPTINKHINKYLADLDFFVSFYLDEEFNETIKSRHRDSFTYANFSAGQKRRIDMAIIMTWRDIAKAKNAINVNVAFFDEMDSVLDEEGAILFHKLIKTSSIENVFLISHKTDALSEIVDNVIRFEVKNNFTQIVEG